MSGPPSPPRIEFVSIQREQRAKVAAFVRVYNAMPAESRGGLVMPGDLQERLIEEVWRTGKLSGAVAREFKPYYDAMLQWQAGVRVER